MTPEDFRSHGLYYDGTYDYYVGHHTQFSILKFDSVTSDQWFYSIITTKSARWDIFITIPIFIAVFALIKKKKLSQ
ncbi:MAG: hypothetical protein ACFFBQ_19265 [Promethearchaeota archaeon]